MRHKPLLLIALSTLVVACGGGGSGDSASTLPPAIPTAPVSGSAVDGLILQGTVSVYNFASGTKGVLLGTATTDNVGHYSIMIRAESTPILIEVTGGYYLEEASGTRVSLRSDQKLTALTIFHTATPLTMAVTPWTHIAAALAIYNASRGTALTSAIDAANSRISTMLGVDIQNTIPVDVTNISNQAATLTPAIQYGWMSAAISLWTYEAMSSIPLQRHTPPYTSINFAQLMYDDVSNDGLLNGIGTAGALSFGTTALTTPIYRHDLGVAMLSFAANTNNKVGMTVPLLLTAARNYADNTDAIWNGVMPVSIETPAVTMTSPTAASWVRRTVTVNGSVNDSAGLISDALLIDGHSVTSAATNLVAPSFLWDSSSVADGAHSLGLSALNVAGMTGSASVIVNVDNTAPVVQGAIASNTILNPSSNDYWPTGLVFQTQCTISGFSGDLGSGLSTLTVTITDNSPAGFASATIPPPNANWAVTLPVTIQLPFSVGAGSTASTSTITISHADQAGNLTTITASARHYATQHNYSCRQGATCTRTDSVTVCDPR